MRHDRQVNPPRPRRDQDPDTDLDPMPSMTRLTRLALAALLAASPVAAHAQSHPMAGKWAIEYAGGMRVENDTPTPIMAKGTLTITEEGDSLVAVLHVEPSEMIRARPDARFATAKVAGKAVTFTQTSQARMNLNGEEHLATAVTTWALTVDGDALGGTLVRRVEGMDGPGAMPTPVTGARVR